MGRTIIPPHTCNERHVHMYAEASMYIVQRSHGAAAWAGGEEDRVPHRHLRLLSGRRNSRRRQPEPDQDVELVFSYGGVGTKEEAGIVFVKDTPDSLSAQGLGRDRLIFDFSFLIED